MMAAEVKRGFDLGLYYIGKAPGHMSDVYGGLSGVRVWGLQKRPRPCCTRWGANSTINIPMGAGYVSYPAPNGRKPHRVSGKRDPLPSLGDV